jgi:hypothetical protein
MGKTSTVQSLSALTLNKVETVGRVKSKLLLSKACIHSLFSWQSKIDEIIKLIDDTELTQS